MTQAPDHIGPFEIRGVLGRGAMAVVWRGYDPTLDREIAIKEPVVPELASDTLRDQYAERFIREARAAARLSHSGIVTVHSVGSYGDRPAIIMELVDGPTLREVIAHRRLDARQAYAVMLLLLSAVAHAHEHGIVHRDLKPENAFLTRDGRVRLADFGIAHVGDSTLTRVGMVLGTPAYMSPEQVRGEAVDARSDVFSLGAIAYELLTGTNPFRGSVSTHYATIVHRIVSVPTPPLELAAEKGGALAGVVLRALKKEADNRFESAAAMLSAWRAALEGDVDVAAEVAGLAVVGTAADGGDHEAVQDVPPTVLEIGPTVMNPGSDPGEGLASDNGPPDAVGKEWHHAFSDVQDEPPGAPGGPAAEPHVHQSIDETRTEDVPARRAPLPLVLVLVLVLAGSFIGLSWLVVSSMMAGIGVLAVAETAYPTQSLGGPVESDRSAEVASLLDRELPGFTLVSATWIGSSEGGTDAEDLGYSETTEYYVVLAESDTVAGLRVAMLASRTLMPYAGSDLIDDDTYTYDDRGAWWWCLVGDFVYTLLSDGGALADAFCRENADSIITEAYIWDDADGRTATIAAFGSHTNPLEVFTWDTDWVDGGGVLVNPEFQTWWRHDATLDAWTEEHYAYIRD